MPVSTPLGVRWTVGDVSPAGFEALQISIASAVGLFGPDTAYAVVVNGMTPAEAAARTGPVPEAVRWLAAPRDPPAVLAPWLGPGMAEGTAWKFAPLRVFPDRHELALDNDVVLWAVPEAVRSWLEDGDPHARVIAADVTPAHGRFADLCGSEPRNSGVRGTPPGFDLEAALGRVLALKPAPLDSELDEQGLQIAALSLDRPPLVVTTAEVSICSPFHPHQPGPGRCGAHFVGLNARDLPWRWYGRPATEVRLEHWRRWRPEMRRRAGLSDDRAVGGTAAGR